MTVLQMAAAALLSLAGCDNAREEIIRVGGIASLVQVLKGEGGASAFSLTGTLLQYSDIIYYTIICAQHVSQLSSLIYFESSSRNVSRFQMHWIVRPVCSEVLMVYTCDWLFVNARACCYGTASRSTCP
jgi:hypothetical protein